MDVEIAVTSNTFGFTESADTIAPLPILGLEASYAITPQWILRGRSDFFYLEFDEYEGHLIDAIFSLEYDFHDYVGVGVGYNYVDINIEADADEFIGELTYIYGTFIAYLKLFI